MSTTIEGRVFFPGAEGCDRKHRGVALALFTALAQCDHAVTLDDLHRVTEERVELDPFETGLTITPDGARWDGVFTDGRWAEVVVHGDGTATLEWDTGTGRPSRWFHDCAAVAMRALRGQ